MVVRVILTHEIRSWLDLAPRVPAALAWFDQAQGASLLCAIVDDWCALVPPLLVVVPRQSLWAAGAAAAAVDAVVVVV